MANSQRSSIVSAAGILCAFFTTVSIAFPVGYGGGDGSAGNPYQIASKTDLLTLASTTTDYGRCFILTADIDLTGESFTTAVIAADADSSTFGLQGTEFTGVFDGNGHAISNLTITSLIGEYKGLFGYLGSGGLIKNLGVVNANVQAASYSGGLVGYVDHSQVTSCYMTGSVSGQYYDVGGLVGMNYYGTISLCYSTGTASCVGDEVGGLVGINMYGSIDSCYATGTVTGDEHVGCLAGKIYHGTINSSYATGTVNGRNSSGGLVGNNDSGTISNCYATGTVNGSGGYIGGLVGYIQYGSLSNCYSTGAVSAGYGGWIGGLVGYNWVWGDPGSYSFTSCFWDTQTSGISDGIDNMDPDPDGVTGKTTAQMKTQTTFTDAGWDFAAVWFMPYDGYPHLKWEDKYSGGSGGGASPFRISKKEDFYKLMGFPGDWNKSFMLTADLNLAGISFGSALISPDTDNAASDFQGTPFTGIFNGNGFVIRNLTLNDSTGRDYLGLFGYVGAGGQIQNLGVENVSTNASGTNSICIGALAGYLSGGAITNCHSTGTLSAGGNNSGSLGGLLGNQNSGTITTCYSTCSVTGGPNNHYLGGLVGAAHDTITRCYSTGSVYAGATSTYYGGLAGYQYGGTISYCSSTSGVSCDTNTRYAGGLIGRSTSYLTTISTISNCYSAGDVSTPGSNDIGGLVGYTTDIGTIITNCYARGSVSGNTRVAGLIGGNEATVSNCYSTGAVEVWGANGGGLIGLNTGTVTNCFWDKQASGFVFSAAGTGKTTAQMKTENTFSSVGWDFAWTDGDSADWVLWTAGADYPVLAWQPATFGGGSGTAADPWKIATVQHLLYLAYNSGYYSGSFLLTADLDMSAYTGTMYKMIGNATTKFTGDFNGGGHIISNLRYSTKGVLSNVGMFGYTSGATIQNLGMDKAVIHTQGDSVGGLIGYQYRGYVNNCFTTGTISGRDAVGGLIGAELGTINNSYSTAAVTGTGSGAGGLMGAISGYLRFGVRKCYSAGSVTGVNFVGGLVGYSNDGAVDSSFWDMQTSGQESSAGGTGKSTTQMKTKSTFTSASWDFSGESANGTADIWRMCGMERGDYPRLSWEFSTGGDFACPDGVSLDDLLYLAGRWMGSTPETAGAADGNGDGRVDLGDFVILSEQWMK